MEQSVEAEFSGFKWVIFILVAILGAVVLYFLITARFTPSWVLGEQIEQPKKYVEVREKDLESYPNLGKFIKNIIRNTSNGEKGVQVLIKGTNSEGERLKSFVQKSSFSGGTYSYIIKYQDKYYGFDILFQFKSPWVL